jgi:hypothetical protein
VQHKRCTGVDRGLKMRPLYANQGAFLRSKALRVYYSRRASLVLQERKTREGRGNKGLLTTLCSTTALRCPPFFALSPLWGERGGTGQGDRAKGITDARQGAQGADVLMATPLVVC